MTRRLYGGRCSRGPHPPRSPLRSSSKPPTLGARAAAYFSSTSPWATSPSRSSPPCPPLAHGHGDVVSVERQRDSSSLHAITTRAACVALETSAKQAAVLKRHRGSIDLDLDKQVSALCGTLDLKSGPRAQPQLLPPRCYQQG
jgi:hypothetical protein